MAKKVSPIAAQVLESYRKIVASVDGVELKGATMPYTSVNGNMFSFLDSEGRLGLRLPEVERESFMKKHHTELCQAHGTILKEYVLVPEAVFRDARKMKTYFASSYEYARSLKEKATTRKKKT